MYDNHVNSAVVEERARYSASAVERATIGCFLAFQEMQLDPRKTQNHVVDRRVALQPAQSASEKKTYKLRLLCDNNRSPRWSVPRI